MNKDPTVSVLLPVYNTRPYLCAAVKNILGQTFGDFELLALDDGSTDESLSILRKFETKDNRVHVWARENRGHVSTLNELIASARGRYLARMDSDDISRPERFEKQVTYLDSHPECVAVGSAFLLIDPEGMPICERSYETNHEEINSAHISGTSSLRICNPSIMMKRDAVLKVGAYREDYQFAEDMDLLLRLAETGKLANLPEVLIEYRHHLESMSYAKVNLQLYDARQAVRAAWRRRGQSIISEVTEPTSIVKSRADVHRKWAWWALGAGNRATARKHAIMAFATDPFSFENLRVLACATRGY